MNCASNIKFYKKLCTSDQMAWINTYLDFFGDGLIGVQVCSSFAEYKPWFLAHVLILAFEFKNWIHIKYSLLGNDVTNLNIPLAPLKSPSCGTVSNT